MKRDFLRWSVRQLLLLITLVAAFLAIVAPRMHRRYSAWNQELQSRRLLEAAARDDFDAAIAAIAAGAAPNARNDRYETVLGIALQRRNPALVETLLAAGADPDYPSGSPFILPLTYAAREGEPHYARRLLEAGADPNAPRSTTLPALVAAAQSGSEETVRLLLTRGARVADDQGRSEPLHEAIAAKTPPEAKLRIIRILLDCGADVTEPVSGRTPMDVAVEAGDAAAADLLREFGAPYTAREAAAFGRLAELKHMVRENPAVLHETTDSHSSAWVARGRTPLGIALARGARETALFLLEAGAPLDVAELEDGNLLDRAIEGGDPKLIHRLISRGFDVNAPCLYDNSPLQRAAYLGRPAAVELLLAAGADVQRRQRSTPLHSAVGAGHVEMARRLLEAGADPHAVDLQRRTPAGMARASQDPKMRALFENLASKTPEEPREP